MSVYHSVSSRTITAITPVSVWLRLKHYMAEDVEPQFVGKKSVFVVFIDRQLLERQVTRLS